MWQYLVCMECCTSATQLATLLRMAHYRWLQIIGNCRAEFGRATVSAKNLLPPPWKKKSLYQDSRGDTQCSQLLYICLFSKSSTTTPMKLLVVVSYIEVTFLWMMIITSYVLAAGSQLLYPIANPTPSEHEPKDTNPSLAILMWSDSNTSHYVDMLGFKSRCLCRNNYFYVHRKFIEIRLQLAI